MASASKDDGIAAALDAEPIRLTFEVGQAAVPAGELARLDAGHVFLLRTPLDRPVAILANGVPFGRGELVQVAGELAVRLLEGDADGA